MNTVANPSRPANHWYRVLGIAAALAFFMLLTRGSHVLSPVSLPDASLALFLLGGLYLGRAGWFALFFMLAAIIDFGMAALDPWQGFCLTDGYWGMIPAYGAMWLGGRWLASQGNAFAAIPYTAVTLFTTVLAFIISTQTYYLFSGRFPSNGISETILHGWIYLPSWLGFAAMYFGAVWIAAQVLRSINIKRTVQA